LQKEPFALLLSGCEHSDQKLAAMPFGHGGVGREEIDGNGRFASGEPDAEAAIGIVAWPSCKNGCGVFGLAVTPGQYACFQKGLLAIDFLYSSSFPCPAVSGIAACFPSSSLFRRQTEPKKA